LMASSVRPRARLALYRLWAWTDTGGLTAQPLTLTELRFSVAHAHTVEVGAVSLTLTELRFSVANALVVEVQCR